MAEETRLRVAFRTDASLDIGNGHVMRCLTLATVLKSRGADCVFVCRTQEGDLINFIRRQGFFVEALQPLLPLRGGAESGWDEKRHEFLLGTDWETDALQSQKVMGKLLDLIVVDHYAIDARWELALSKFTRKLMVIDDLADRPHHCDLLLDQNLGSQLRDYEGRVSDRTLLLIGPQYALLRPDFARLRQYSLDRRRLAKPSRILVTLGGIDIGNITQRVLRALSLQNFSPSIDLTVVMGPNAPWHEAVALEAGGCRHQTRVLTSVDDMATLMADTDISIGAAGSTSWERCTLGIPTLLVTLAHNQIAVGNMLASAGAVTLLQLNGDFDANLNSSLKLLLSDDYARKKMVKQAARICDGTGSMRVADTVLRLLGCDR